jgi:hypothetical protein
MLDASKASKWTKDLHPNRYQSARIELQLEIMGSPRYPTTSSAPTSSALWEKDVPSLRMISEHSQHRRMGLYRVIGFDPEKD